MGSNNSSKGHILNLPRCNGKKDFMEAYSEFEEQEYARAKFSTKQKRTPKKSKHKHEYEEIAVISRSSDKFNNPNMDRKHKVIAERCKICGKIGDVHFFLRVGEFEERLKDLELYETDEDIFRLKYL